MRVMAKEATEPLYKSLLQERRIAAGLSGRALARRAGVSIGTVNMAERRARGVYLQSAAKIAAALGAPLAALFEPAEV